MLRASRRAMTFRCKSRQFVFAVTACAIAFLSAAQPACADSIVHDSKQFVLRDGWMLQSSCKVRANGAQISKAGFRTDRWHTTNVPSTVLAALVADKTYRDPYFGMNLRSIPATTYPLGKNFSEMPMPIDSPFRCSWWYRTECIAPPSFEGLHVSLNFEGINSRANVWLNGHGRARPL